MAELRKDRTLAPLCMAFELHPNTIGEWTRQLVAQAAEVFGGMPTEPPVELAPLHGKIGQWALAKDLLDPALNTEGWPSARP